MAENGKNNFCLLVSGVFFRTCSTCVHWGNIYDVPRDWMQWPAAQVNAWACEEEGGEGEGVTRSMGTFWCTALMLTAGSMAHCGPICWVTTQPFTTVIKWWDQHLVPMSFLKWTILATNMYNPIAFWSWNQYKKSYLITCCRSSLAIEYRAQPVKQVKWNSWKTECTKATWVLFLLRNTRDLKQIELLWGEKHCLEVQEKTKLLHSKESFAYSQVNTSTKLYFTFHFST